MDITTNTTTTSIKTPEAEAENPIRIQQPLKPLSFTNGVLKRHHHNHSPPAVVTYRECLKNHAASLGGHAVDGCGEFMPSPTASQTDPTSLKCAACGCHRNFHRREPDEPHVAPPGTATAQHVIEYQPHHRHHPPPPPLPRGHSSSPNSPSPPPISSAYYPSAPHMLLALSHGVSGPLPENNPLASPTVSLQNGRKRFRTKFTAEQKEKMQEFAEKVGWKMQKKDEEVIGEFCNQVGVDKGVLKVWMHNNKSTLGKRERDAIDNGNGNGNGNGSLDTTTTTTTTATHYHHHDGENNHLNISHHLHNSDDVVITNGSSSSS